MDAHRQREIARKGGRAAHEKGKAHEFTPDEARAAGRKGGEKVSVNRKHMAEIGRRGGRSSAQRRRPSVGEQPSIADHEATAESMPQQDLTRSQYEPRPLEEAPSSARNESAQEIPGQPE